MKKEYLTPVVEMMNLEAGHLLVASGVGSNYAIGFGGVDEAGTLDPASKMELLLFVFE